MKSVVCDWLAERADHGYKPCIKLLTNGTRPIFSYYHRRVKYISEYILFKLFSS